jgi:anaphase-promoting complex subunit 8
MAILHFQRAIKLDSQHLGAWVLMGHEYLEMRATSPAIQCYRKALQGDPHDHRAWYALGQCYELLKMPSYALFYYKKAVEFRPLDSRMWSALSTIHQQLGNLPKAISTLKRAISLQSPEDAFGHLQLQKLATLHLKAFQPIEAMEAYEQLVEMPSFWTQPSSQDICAVLWKLALHSYQQQKWQQAKKYCMKIYELNGMEREGAQELLALLQEQENSEAMVHSQS